MFQRDKLGGLQTLIAKKYFLTLIVFVLTLPTALEANGSKIAPEFEMESMTDIHLTKREKQILREICNAQTVKEIAEKLNVSTGTIETHKRTLINKTNARNTLDLAVMAVREGWV